MLVFAQTCISLCSQLLSIVLKKNYLRFLGLSGVDARADIWSLGCLFFELLTGEFLFEDDARSCLPFVLRVIDEEQPLLTAEQQAMLGCVTALLVVCSLACH